MTQATYAGTGVASPLPGILKPEALFSRARAYTTREVRNAHADVAKVFFRHTLSRFRTGDELNFCHRGAALRHTSFNVISYGADVCVGVDYIDRDRFVVVAPLSGTAHVDYHGRNTPIARGQFIVLDPMQTFRWEMSSDHSHLAVGIPARLVREAHAQAGSSRRGLFGRGPIPITEQVVGFFEYVDYLCRELDRPHSFVSAPAVADTLESSLLKIMVAVLREHDGTAEAGMCRDGTTPASVAKAEAYMREHLRDDISMDDVVAASGVPMRTLYRSFDRYRAMSPKQWLQRERLEHAHAELLAAASTGVTVTDVAARYGATNAGRFARAYLAHFGEAPSDTRRRALSRLP